MVNHVEQHRRTRLSLALVLCGGLLVSAYLLFARTGGASRAISVEATGSAPSAQAGPTTPAPGSAGCGSELPKSVAIPPGYSGPKPGPSPDATVAPAAGQLAFHWTSGTGSVEARWPSDAGKQIPTGPSPVGAPSAAQSFSALVSREAVSAGGGRSMREMLFDLPGDQRAQCRTFQVDVFDADGSRLNSVFDNVVRHPFESSIPLVTASRQAPSAPPVAPCSASAGVRTPPNRVTTNSASEAFSTPTDALRSFLAGQPTLLPDGYVEFKLPNGALAYGHPGFGPTNQDSFVTVIEIAPNTSGWSVLRVIASGC